MYVCFFFAAIKTLNEQMHTWKCTTPHVKSYNALMSGKTNVLQLDLEQLWNNTKATNFWAFTYM